MSENEDKMKSMYGEEVDISMPDGLLVPEIMEEGDATTTELKEIKDDNETAFSFAFIGAGQGGSRLAQTFKKLGYNRVAAINTAEQDLNTLDLENKLCIGDGGAGKDKSKAKELFEAKKDDVLDFMRYSFGEKLDRIMICVGAGGGTGAGVLMPLIETAQELQHTLNSSSKQVGVILALPKSSEGKKVNLNALETLTEAMTAVRQKRISPLILVDNEKISNLHPNLSVSNFFDAVNSQAAGLFHLFNLTANKNSSYVSFDANDFKQVLDSGLIVFGASPVADWKDPVAIVRVIRNNLSNNLLSDGVDVSTGTSAGVIVIAGNEVLDNVSQNHLDQAFSQVNRMLKKGSTVHRGIYSGKQNNLTIFCVVGGLEMPMEKINSLRSSGDVL